MDLARKYQIEMPIATEVYKVVITGNTARDAFRGLLKIDTKSESELV